MLKKRSTSTLALLIALSVGSAACVSGQSGDTHANAGPSSNGVSAVAAPLEVITGDAASSTDEVDEGPTIDVDVEAAGDGESLPPEAFVSVPSATSELVAASGPPDDSTDTELTLSLDIEGLPPLNCCDLIYAAWLVADGITTEAGVFDVGFDGALIDPVDGGPARFDSTDGAEGLIVTVENRDRKSSSASPSRILAGAFDEDGTAQLTTTNTAALGTDFSEASGTYILATPTNGLPDSNELSGIWFEFLPDATPSLTLPTLPDGWVYEGWVEIDGRPISLGRFTDPAMADDFDGFSATLEPAPPVPGEDLLVSPPEDLVFPLSLQGQVTFISVESVLDTDARPFALQPLIADIDPDAVAFANLPLGPGFTDISGVATVG